MHRAKADEARTNLQKITKTALIGLFALLSLAAALRRGLTGDLPEYVAQKTGMLLDFGVL